ncbi:DUF4236 domain-containing protein [Chryseobacterium gotjawalense]|uniref:DUF4236 domain-containing protein n=1 Tax=Chryseobacterium gotjawalense TaxID=3042315 RepID=A0ABY8R9P6_9FLAO|nr:DUF4236 domain-containing protein [Chryseobacterium sp. wdc7]WHF50655.1 DUF4236 domain-containing protein [Chryseobacterium sp. wdc7]
MAWQFRRRIKIAPGVKINLSKSGISTSVGVRGANVTFGKSGTYLNTGIPGTGIYNRQRISGVTPPNISSPQNKLQQNTNIQKDNGCGIITIIVLIALFIFLYKVDFENPTLVFLSRTVSIIIAISLLALFSKSLFSTTQNNELLVYDTLINSAKEEIAKSTDSVKNEILKCYINDLQISKQIEIKLSKIKSLQAKNAKKTNQKFLQEIDILDKEISVLENNQLSAQYNIDATLNDTEKQAFEQMVYNFVVMSQSEKIWFNNGEFSSILQGLTGGRKEIRFTVGSFSGISRDFQVPILPDSEENHYYLYPKFVIKAKSSTQFELFPLKDFKVEGVIKIHYDKQFPPNDSEVTGHFYRHQNKDGSPDLRYSDNPKIYSVNYYELRIWNDKSSYIISNSQSASNFVSMANNYLSIVNGTKNTVSEIIHPINSQNKSEFDNLNPLSENYFNLIRDFVPTLFEIISKLGQKKFILELFKVEDKEESEIHESIKSLIIYDLLKISRLISSEVLTKNTSESWGIALITGSLLNDNIKGNLILNHSAFLNIYNSNYVDKLLTILSDFEKKDNPVHVTAYSKSNPTNDLVKEQNYLALPIILKVNDSDLLDEYATVLYQFANIIVKADNTVSVDEEKKLTEIFELTHKPMVDLQESKTTESKIINPSNETETLEDVLQELNSLIGLKEVKEQIISLMNFIKVQKAREDAGLKSTALSYHLVLSGNPGTGKTTVARLLARIYKLLGIVKKGHIVETDRSGLIAEYSGQTAVKVNKTVDSALDGILFIDEAYALVGENKDDFGKEAVATLIKRIEDDRDKLIVILAGYTDEMMLFINTNPGFKSRFNRFIEFPDYNVDELYEIFESNCKKLDYHLSDNAKEKLKLLFENSYSQRDMTFGNGRYVRNVFEKTLENQANRIAKEINLTRDILTQINEEDIPE